jgi:hypothetical protein
MHAVLFWIISSTNPSLSSQFTFYVCASGRQLTSCIFLNSAAIQEKMNKLKRFQIQYLLVNGSSQLVRAHNFCYYFEADRQTFEKPVNHKCAQKIQIKNNFNLPNPDCPALPCPALPCPALPCPN